MDAKALIESYVDDVVRRLPRKQRNDVGFELRALLGEELQARAEAPGAAPDAETVMDLLRAFGDPKVVAARYRPPGFEIIAPADAPAFVGLALGGVAVQWALSLTLAFTAATGLGPVQRFSGWWIGGGLGALWWPGFLVMTAIIASGARRRWPAVAVWTPRIVDPDRINRPLWSLALAFFLCGAAVLVTLPWTFDQLIGGLPVHRALTFDRAFFIGRGPWLLPIWAAQFSLLGVLIMRGRWTRITRRIDIVLSLAISSLMVWFIAGGPIFLAAPTDQIAKFSLAAVTVITLIDAGLKLRRERARVATPSAVKRRAGQLNSGVSAI
jgi:hypothetical protein